MRWRRHLVTCGLFASIIFVVSLIVAQIGYCPYSPCVPFGWCTTEAGDSQPLGYCNSWNSCEHTLNLEGSSPWCCNYVIEDVASEPSIKVGSIRRVTPFLASIGCCQYQAQIYTCVSTNRTVVVVINGNPKPAQICDSATGLCVFYA